MKLCIIGYYLEKTWFANKLHLYIYIYVHSNKNKTNNLDKSSDMPLFVVKYFFFILEA